MNIKEHMPAILSATAGVGVGVTGYFSARLGMQIEAEKANLKSEDNEIQKGAKWRIVFKAIPAVSVGLLSIGCIVMSHHLSKKQLAEAMAALAVQTKLFNDYRNHEDPERDKEIMEEIALENADIDEREELEEGMELWTDPYIAHLSDGKITYYKAKETDILRAGMYLKDKFSDEQSFCATLRDFYDELRLCGVEELKQEMKGETGIYWEPDEEWYDYNGSFHFDFDYSTKVNENGVKVHTIYFSETNEEIHENDRKLHEWFANSKDKQDLIDYIARN